MAYAVNSASTGEAPRMQVFWLLATIVLGTVFLGVKVIEYTDKINHHLVPGSNFHFPNPAFQDTAQIYYSLYFGLTGLHASHMIIGIGIMAVIAWKAGRGQFTPEWYTPVEITGLYWHFVDLVWILIFTFVYLIPPAEQAVSG